MSRRSRRAGIGMCSAGGSAHGVDLTASPQRVDVTAPALRDRACGTDVALLNLRKDLLLISSPEQLSFSDCAEPVQIRSSTVLPARRSNCEFTTADGKRLLGELAIPDGVMKAMIVSFHPLPTHGGFMDSHVYRKASYRLPAQAGIGILRFNTRGTSSARGTSEGEFDGGTAEREDVLAAVRFVREFYAGPIWLLGWSFGTELVLKYGSREPVRSEIEGAVLLSPPLHRADDTDLAAWEESGKPLLVLVPEHDDYLQPEEASRRFAAIRAARVVGVDGAKHLWVGEKYVRIVLDLIAGEILGEPTALPETWHGPSATVA